MKILGWRITCKNSQQDDLASDNTSSQSSWPDSVWDSPSAKPTWIGEGEGGIQLVPGMMPILPSVEVPGMKGFTEWLASKTEDVAADTGAGGAVKTASSEQNRPRLFLPAANFTARDIAWEG